MAGRYCRPHALPEQKKEFALRLIIALTATAFLGACGVGGDPKHPEETMSFSGSLSLGASHSF